MNRQRFWGLFWIAMAMAAHSLIVGRLLGSSFFMLLFFWGWVAAAAYRGELAAARSMAIVMIGLLAAAAVALAFRPAGMRTDLAYYTFALYPALVSWVCVYVYVRHLQQRSGVAASASGQPSPAQRTA